MRKMMLALVVLGVSAAVATAQDQPAAAESTEPAEEACPKAVLPLKLYGDCDDEFDPPYIPSGWMGNYEAIERDECCEDNPHSGKYCIKLTYNDVKGWAGIVWQDPPNDWGDEFGGWDISGARRLVFWARGEKGEELVEFKFGILGRNKAYPDSARGSLGRVKLTKEWKEYSIPVEGKDLRCIKTGFVWVVVGRKKPITFYLDDIRWE
ncbi:MAG TPA: hypothetical protein EYP62_07840 [Kiritimatiellae bacterium]|nr:hypothetical protein [Kiritimatiellia bacterium]